MDIQEMGDALPEDEELEAPAEESHSRTGRAKDIDWQALRDQIARLGETGGGQNLSDEQSQTILQARAKALAMQAVEEIEETKVTEIVTFAWGDENFAIETFYVHEIVLPRRITMIPDVPDFVLGVMNLRGEIIPIFDIRGFLGVSDLGVKPGSKIIIIGREQVEFGMVADSTSVVYELLVSEILEPPVASDGGSFVLGVTSEMTIILDGDIVLRDDRLYIDRG